MQDFCAKVCEKGDSLNKKEVRHGRQKVVSTQKRDICPWKTLRTRDPPVGSWFGRCSFKTNSLAPNGNKPTFWGSGSPAAGSPHPHLGRSGRGRHHLAHAPGIGGGGWAQGFWRRPGKMILRQAKDCIRFFPSWPKCMTFGTGSVLPAPTASYVFVRAPLSSSSRTWRQELAPRNDLWATEKAALKCPCVF